MKNFSLKKLVLIAIFVAISVIGANIKIAGSIAFDSFPGFLGALLLGPISGGIIAALGHLITALTSGFPYGLPAHIIIMVMMFIAASIFSIIQKKFSKISGIIVAIIIAVIINGPLSVFVLIPMLGSGLIALIPVLTLVAAINIVIAQILYEALKNRIK